MSKTQAEQPASLPTEPVMTHRDTISALRREASRLRRLAYTYPWERSAWEQAATTLEEKAAAAELMLCPPCSEK